MYLNLFFGGGGGGGELMSLLPLMACLHRKLKA